MDRVPASVARVFDRALARDPGHEALVTRGQRLTYAELDALADRAAQALRQLGVGTGDRVAASLPNEADVVVAFHGAMRLGAVWVGVNRALAPPEKRYLLDDCGATLLLSDDDVGDLGVRRVDLAAWRAAVDAAPAEPVGVEVDPLAPAGIAYTSGTTGHPKGAVHSQRNLLAPGAMLVESRGYGPDLRKGDCFPFTILNLAVLTTLLVSQAGGTADRDGPHRRRGRGRVGAHRADHHLERGAGDAPQPGDERRRERRRTWPRWTRCGPAGPTAPRSSAPPSRPSSAGRCWPPTG